MNYIEIAIGSPRHSSTVIHKDELSKYIVKAQSADLELYRSVFSFDEDIVDHMRLNKSPSGYGGNKYLDRLVFDIDKGKNTDILCLHKTREFGTLLTDVWKIPPRLIYFYHSGNGYHIVVPDIFRFAPDKDLPKIVKRTLDSAFDNSIDTVFYHNAGLIRVENTLNEKTGRYKVLLTRDQVYNGDVEDIIAYSKEHYGVLDVLDLSLNGYELPDRSHLIKKVERNDNLLNIEEVAISRNAPCFQAMYNAGEEEGTRHVRIIRLASHYRRQGIPLEASIAALQRYAPSLEEYEVEKQVRSVYDKGYVWGCHDEELKKFCTVNCTYYKDKDYSPDVLTAADLEKRYRKHIRTNYGDSAFNFAELYNLDGKSCMVYPGNFVLLFGESGLGKTAIAQNIGLMLDKMNVLYVSTEFGLYLLHRRFVQLAHNLDRDSVDNHYINSDASMISRLKHINYYGQGMTTIELEKMVKRLTPNLIILDVVDGIKAPNREPGTVGNDVEVVECIRRIVSTQNTIVLGVHHLSKHAAEDNEGKAKKLTMHSGKGSSSFEQKADIVLGLEGKEAESTRILSTLKGRDIDPFRLLLSYDRSNFKFTKIQL